MFQLQNQGKWISYFTIKIIRMYNLLTCNY